MKSDTSEQPVLAAPEDGRTPITLLPLATDTICWQESLWQKRAKGRNATKPRPRRKQGANAEAQSDAEKPRGGKIMEGRIIGQKAFYLGLL